MRQLLLLIIFPCTIFAQENTSRFAAYLKAESSFYNFNGNVLVAKNGHIIYRQSIGYADYTTKQALDSNSIFDCGSIAKEFTSVGILLLKDKGKLSYSDTITKFFPLLPYSNVTIGQLLSHASGMPNGCALVAKYADHSKVATNDDLIYLLQTKKPPLLFTPGTDVMYSGTAFNVLASLIEKLSGQSYNTYMEEHIFKPLGMAHSRVANGPRSATAIPGYAYGYLYSDSLKKYVPSDTEENGWPTYLAGITGEGMIITTTGDLFKWDRALKQHQLLSETTQQEMLTMHSHKKFPPVSFGYGMIVGSNSFGNYAFHNGYYPGYKSMHLRYIDDDVTVIVLSNNEASAEFIADGLSAITLNKNFEMPVAHTEVQNQPSAKYAGRYMIQLTHPPFMAVYPMEFVTRDNSLYIRLADGNEMKLKAESATKFFFADGTDQQIEFETDRDGNVLKVWHIAWGVKKELRKAE